MLQERSFCERLIAGIVEPLRVKAGGWSQLVYMLLQERDVIDRHTVVAMETLMLVHTHFELTTSLVRYLLRDACYIIVLEYLGRSSP